MARIQFAVGVGTGTPIALRVGDSVTWQLAYGVTPVIGEIETSWSRAEEIFQQARYQFPSGDSADAAQRGRTGPLEIFATPSQGQERNFKNLYALALRAGSDKRLGRVVITDSRYWWRHVPIERAYNVPRNSGDHRLESGKLVPIQNRQVLADLTYRRVSMRNPESETPEPWTARTALDDVMGELAPNNYTIPTGVVKQTDWTDGVTLRDRGHAALARLLSFVPGVQPYQTEEGRISFGNVFDGSEGVVALQFRDVRNAGYVRLDDRSPKRSKSTTVFFPRELELRFDFRDVGGEDDPGTTQARGREDPIFENVIQCPLYELELTGGRKATRGEYLTLPVFLSAFNRLRATKTLSKPGIMLTQAEIRRHFLGTPEAFRFRHAALPGKSGLYDGDMISLIAALLTHWRATFRISSKWMDKIYGLKALLSAILSGELGVRAKAIVFADWIEKFGQQAFLGSESQNLAIQHRDYADNLEGAKASPFDVQVLDADNGVFTIVPRVHQEGVADDYVLGVADGMPNAKIGDVKSKWYAIGLEQNFQLAVILSAIQDSPNSLGRLHRETVSIEEAAGLLGAKVPGSNYAPDDGIISQLDTARFGWVDSRREEILSAVFGSSVDGEGQVQVAPQIASDLLVNRRAVRDIAVAEAARALAPNLDRWRGRLVVSHAPSVNPTGNLREVTHTITNTPEGLVCTTVLDFPGDVEPLDLGAVLPEQTRRVLRKDVGS